MDHQKPVKVKSRWTQSCQMEMMIKGSQSSLGNMSDNNVDVSNSDINENADYSSEPNCLKLRRSRRTGINKADYKQLNGIKTNRQKLSVPSNTSNKRGRRTKQLLHTSKIDDDNKFENNISQAANIITHHSIDWNNITTCQSSRHSKSVDNISKVVAQSNLKSIRRASLIWEFKYIPTNDVEDNNRKLEKEKHTDLSNKIMHLNLNETQLETSLSADNSQLYKDYESTHEESPMFANTSQQPYSDIDAFNGNDFQQTNEVVNIEFDKISITNLNKQTKNDELIIHVNQFHKENPYPINSLVTPKTNLSELSNLVLDPINKFKKIRSKSLDEPLRIKTNSTIKHSNIDNDINKLDDSVVNNFKLIEKSKNESQSSLDMSDNNVDVSNSEVNESADYNSEPNCVKLRRSRRTGIYKADYKPFNGIRRNRQKPSVTSKTSNKRGRGTKKPFHTSKIDDDSKFENNISQESNVIRNPSIDLSSKQLNSVGNIKKVFAQLPLKSIRRASLIWEFKYIPTNDVEDNNSKLEKDKHTDFSNGIMHLNVNDTRLETSSSVDNSQLYKDYESTHKENPMFANTSQQQYSDIYAINENNFQQTNEVVNIEFDKISITNLNKQTKKDELIIHVNQFEKQNPYQINSLVTPKTNLSELENLVLGPINKFKKIHSKSLDEPLRIKANSTIKYSKSDNDINKLDDSEINIFKSIKKSKIESQSSLYNMSDNNVVVLNSEVHESEDYSSEPNCVKLRRSRRTGINKADYKPFKGIKPNRQKPSVTSKTSNKRGQRTKKPLHTSKIDENSKFENNISQESNIIRHPSIDWNNIIICQSSRQSKSVSNMSKVAAQLPLKSIRRASLIWEFKYIPTNNVEDNNSKLEKEKHTDLSNGLMHLTLNETQLETSSSVDSSQLYKDYESTHEESPMIANTSQQPYSDIDALNDNNIQQTNEVVNIEFDKISITNLNKQTKNDELIIHVNQFDKQNPYPINALVTSKTNLSELENLVLGPISKFKKIRSKSLDEPLRIKAISTIKHSKSDNDINKLDDSVVNIFKSTKKSKIESQSPLDNMSNNNVDVSNSEVNESADYSSDPNCVKLRRSRRTGINKADYKQLNGIKTNRQKPSVTSKTSNKRGRKTKKPLHTSKIDDDNKFENNILQESNIIRHPSIDWNNILICQSSRPTKSVGNLSKVAAQWPLKSIRRSSLNWEFKYTPTNDVEDNNSKLEKEKHTGLSNGFMNLNQNETQLETYSSVDNSQLYKDYESTHEDSPMIANTSQQPYSDIDAFNGNDFQQTNEVVNIEFDKISITNLNKQTQNDELIIHVNQFDKQNPYPINALVTSKTNLSELENLVLGPISKFKKIRSKSLDEPLRIKAISTIKYSKSDNDINKLDDSVVNIFKSTKKSKIESQSPLDNMSDNNVVVSNSEVHESRDYSSEPNCVKLRRSRRTGINKADYKPFNGIKPNRQKPSVTSKTSNKRGRRTKKPLHTSKIDDDNKFENNILQESNIITHPSKDWNNIIICQSSRQSKSVSNMSKVAAQSPLKSIRRASLIWEFKYIPTNDVEDKNSKLKKDKHTDFSNGIMHLNVNDTQLETSSSVDSSQLYKDYESTYKESPMFTNTSQLPYSDIDALNSNDFQQTNEVVNIEFDKISIANLNKQTKNDELIIHVNQFHKENPYPINALVTPKINSSELENLVLGPISKFKKIRSKSLDEPLRIKTNSTIKHSKSDNDINILDDSVVNIFKLIEKSTKKSIPNKRRKSKRIKCKTVSIEIPDDIPVPEINYGQVADEIFREHQNQLLKARINDKEFDKKLKSTNFTLINENLYRPNRHNLKLYPLSEISALRKLKQRVISGDINDYCECTLSKEDIIEGNIGCDDRCVNRLLKVECGSGCSLKRYCSNKQFQNKQFKKINLIKTENKGYGICAVEDIPKGVLINEFVGEVIDYNEMCNRLKKKEYENKNFLVQLNSDEIIDSTSKGNMTRFINHSCDPNSVGEKWYVLGQSRIGFFSIRHIKKGEEITFDYSFQIFGDSAQVCYCGSSNCRGYISKASQITDVSSSEDSDSATENCFVSRSKEKEKEKEKRKIICEERAVYNNNNKKLRELSKQLTEIAKLKTGLKADQEMATLNLNRLMVHITDSVSRLHVLTFIRSHDMNKRLFMDFSGLSIIHNWMTSNENESFKLMILEILAELPITNRNTITKSKVLDVVTEWANIPQDIKTKIESFDYPVTELQDIREIDKILPTNNEIDETNSLVEKARALWKKWIVLKIVFKIPKKIDQPKPITETNSAKFSDNAVETTTLERKMYGISNQYVNKVQNPHTGSLKRIKLRNEYELKVEQNRKKMFRKKVMDDWYEKRERVLEKKPEEIFLKHSQSLKYNNYDSPKLNCNTSKIDYTKWDYSSQMASTSQNPVVNYNMQIPGLNFMPPQPVIQQQFELPQCSFMQTQTFPNYHLVNQPSFFNTPPPSLYNHSIISKPQYSISLNKPANQNIKSPEELTRNLVKSAEAQVFNLINKSLRKHYSKEDKNINTETKDSNKLRLKTVQSGADLLARIKVVSDSFKKQPSKLIKIKHSKQNYDKSKLKKAAMLQSVDAITDLTLKSYCNKNKTIIFNNEQTGVTSYSISEELMPTPKTISFSRRNKFANDIFNSLFKKVMFKPHKFVLQKFNSVDTIDKNNTEIELYKNMRPKIIKKVVAHIQTKDGFMPIIKRQRGIQLKGLKENHEKIPVAEYNIMRKGNIHRLSLQNSLINRTKSALKRRNSINGDDYLKKSKEKRVTFWIEGEASPIFPYSEVRPINLNQSTVKQKPLMKCHPFEIRNEPKSILQPSTSAIQGDSPLLEEISDITNNDQIILPIVAKFNASRNRRISLRNKSIDLEQLLSERTHMIPASMMSLSMDVLRLIPDNRKEMKKVIDYYHSMATVIVKTLGSYAKKTCQQGRIRSDEDFKYLAKKINENVLLKELQLKKVDKLKITNNTKEKVAEYIRKYMSRFGEVYKRKSNEQTNNHKTK